MVADFAVLEKDADKIINLLSIRGTKMAIK